MTRVKKLLAELRSARRTAVLFRSRAQADRAALFASRYFLEERSAPFLRYFVTLRIRRSLGRVPPPGLGDAFPYSGTMLVAFSTPLALGDGWSAGGTQLPRALVLCSCACPCWSGLHHLRHPPALVSHRRRGRAGAPTGALRCFFYISYVHGQIDAIPTAYYSRRAAAAARSPKRAGVWLGAAVGAKFHVAAAVPLIACTSSARFRPPNAGAC